MSAPLALPEGLSTAFSPGSRLALPQIFIRASEAGRPLPVADPVQVHFNGQDLELPLLPIRELFRGDARAPDLSGEPPREFMPAFFLVERTIALYCDIDRRDETDQEMERLLAQLKRRPDGKDRNPLFGYIRAAFRLYMSAVPTSQAVFEAMVQRLVRSARVFSQGDISRNYLGTLRRTVER